MIHFGADALRAYCAMYRESKIKTRAIKVVISGSDTVNVAQIKDLRVIALPEGTAS